MDAFGLLKSQALRGEYDVDKLAKEAKRIVALVKILNIAKAGFLRLTNRSARLQNCKDFIHSYIAKGPSSDEIPKLELGALLFSSICFTQKHLKDIPFEASEIEIYVEAYPELKDPAIQKIIIARLNYHMRARDECEELLTRLNKLTAEAHRRRQPAEETQTLPALQGTTIEDDGAPSPQCAQELEIRVFK